MSIIILTNQYGSPMTTNEYSSLVSSCSYSHRHQMGGGSCWNSIKRRIMSWTSISRKGRVMPYLVKGSPPVKKEPSEPSEPLQAWVFENKAYSSRSIQRSVMSLAEQMPHANKIVAPSYNESPIPNMDENHVLAFVQEDANVEVIEDGKQSPPKTDYTVYSLKPIVEDLSLGGRALEKLSLIFESGKTMSDEFCAQFFYNNSFYIATRTGRVVTASSIGYPKRLITESLIPIIKLDRSKFDDMKNILILFYGRKYDAFRLEKAGSPRASNTIEFNGNHVTIKLYGTKEEIHVAGGKSKRQPPRIMKKSHAKS